MEAVYRKELKICFTGLTGYLFIALVLATAGVFSISLNLSGSYTTSFEYVLYNMTIVFLLTVPLLTMNTLAGERRNKTDQLLLTSPLSITKIILGKFLALLTVLAIPIALMSFYPLILSMFGTVNFLSVYSTFLCFLFLGAALIALCIFISSLTESQIIAAVISMFSLFFAYLVPYIVDLISTKTAAVIIACLVLAAAAALFVYRMMKNPNIAIAVGAVIAGVCVLIYIYDSKMLSAAVVKFLGWFAVFDFLNDFVYNLFDITALVYYASVIFLFLFLTVKNIEKRRWS